jgi:hypothetical protein
MTTTPTTTVGAEARGPRVFEKTGTIQITATTSGIPAAAVLVCIVAQPHYHLPAKHDDPIMLGSEVGLALILVFVGWRLVGSHLLHRAASDEEVAARP